ncbi:MAG: hypothetical protein AAF298_18345 [Cyanobacteria bacterium P01_A01_bin.40]
MNCCLIPLSLVLLPLSSMIWSEMRQGHYRLQLSPQSDRFRFNALVSAVNYFKGKRSLILLIVNKIFGLWNLEDNS